MHRVYDTITLGKKLRTRPAGAMTVHEVRYPGAWSVPTHAHAHANLTFVYQGSIEESARGTSRILRACDAVLKPAETLHSNRCGPDGARTLVIEFPDPTISASHSDNELRQPYAILQGPEVIRTALRALDLLRGDIAGSVGELEELLTETFALAPVASRDRSTRGEPWLEKVRELLHEGFAVPIRVRELADVVGRHPVYVARAFRRRHGCSVTAYRRRVQVCDAVRRLLDGEEPLASIAASSGFADQSHFCRAFRAVLGVSPGAFRRSVRVS